MASSLKSQVRPLDFRSMASNARSREHAALGTALRELREERDLTQQQLAKKAGVAPTFLSDVERGTRNPSWSTILSIAKALKVKPSELVARAE
jgi:transcriptional regulator with XRE-family HTH domain